MNSLPTTYRECLDLVGEVGVGTGRLFTSAHAWQTQGVWCDETRAHLEAFRLAVCLAVGLKCLSACFLFVQLLVCR